ncbi:MAG: GAF domain-containing sensor histidine kinase, partial [Pseudomonadota bacterium]
PIHQSSDQQTDAVVRGVPDVASVNRIKLRLGTDGTIGVLTFFSRNPNYYLLSDKIGEVRNAMEAKYLQVRHQAHQQMDQINQQFIETYTAGQLVAFLESIACEVKHRFQVEACAIFLADKDKVHLDLVASCDQKNRGKPTVPYTYHIDDESQTIEVFRAGNPRFSYNLTVDDPEQTGYQNETEHPPRNWIGVPLQAAGECFGVLRIHNKFSVDSQGTHNLTNFTTGDFINLQALCSNLANLVRIESLFLETSQKLADTNESMAEMNDFNKVFMHEIRTPISKFTMAPEIIKRSLTSPNLDEQSLNKVVRQLDDIQLMGDRLEFITKAFNFDQIVTRRDFQTLSVLRDIIYPIINITRPYLRKQYDLDIDLVTTGLSSMRVYGDKTLLNIVFNTLIDNAGKYTVDTHQSIVVEGNSLTIDGADYFDIIVSNYGLPIHTEEAATIFEKGARGDEAKRRGIGGTGIGLHLAQQIMHEGGGDLLLTSNHDPVSFSVRIPRRAPRAHADHE